MSHYQAGQPLAAGQLNDDVHQGIRLIEEKRLDADQTTVSFSSIPQTYQSLWLFMSAGVTGTSPRFVTARFNGDTGSNYTSHAFQTRGDGTTGTDYNSPASFVAIGVINTNLAAQNSVYFPAYASTSRQKSVLSTFAAPQASDSAGSLLGFAGGQWDSTSAITDITLQEQPGSGIDDMVAGSIFTLYGLGSAES